MSGHSKWATTKRQKAIVDAKRGAAFTHIGNLIAIAARSGADPATNPNLALAIEKAKAVNMPNDNIKRAIARVSDKNAAALTEDTYEAYGPGGIGIIIETATDNKNRTVPEVKSALTKNGGRLADAGSVMFQFKRKGIIIIEGSGEETLLQVLDAGAEDASEDPESNEITIYTADKDLMKVRAALVETGITVKSAELQYVPDNLVPIADQETSEKVLKLLNALDDLDDVTNVSTNAEV